MSPSSANDTKPTPILGVLFSLLVAFTSLISPACDKPESLVIARFPGEGGVGAGGATGGGAGAAAGNLEAGAAGGGQDLPSIPAQRGRVTVFEGKLLTDLGTPLRGMLLPIDTDWALADFTFLHTLAQTTGLNAIHVYLENSDLVVGSKQDAADSLVALAAEEGLYVIIGYGTGVNIGMVDTPKLTAFWTNYAARYGNRSHVLFEVQNNPEVTTCMKNVKAATVTTEQTIYKLIRSKAPNSHVLLFSTTSIVTPAVFTDAVTRLGTTVDWSNASFALGVTDVCLPAADFSTLAAAAKTAGVPLIINQLPRDGWAPYIPLLEQEGVGWLQYRWFGNQSETLPSFIKAVTAAPVTWCPERGTFPEDSATCR